MKKGIVDISELRTPPEEHELAAANFFAKDFGKNIKFIRPSNISGTHTPDFWMDKISWELKTPKGKTVRCISDNIRDAVKQSENIVLDLRRIKIPSEKCIMQAQKDFLFYTQIKRLLIITRDSNLLTLLRVKYRI